MDRVARRDNRGGPLHSSLSRSVLVKVAGAMVRGKDISINGYVMLGPGGRVCTRAAQRSLQLATLKTPAS